MQPKSNLVHFSFKYITSGGNSFNDFHKIVQITEITTKIEKIFLFLLVTVGPFIE